MLWGTTRWAASYGRRTGVESSNAEIKQNDAVMDRGYTRVFGLAKNPLLLAFGLAGVNIRLLRHWHARRGRPDPWVVELAETHDPPSPPQQRASRPARRPSSHQIIDRRGPPNQEHHPSHEHDDPVLTSARPRRHVRRTRRVRARKRSPNGRRSAARDKHEPTYDEVAATGTLDAEPAKRPYE